MLSIHFKKDLSIILARQKSIVIYLADLSKLNNQLVYEFRTVQITRQITSIICLIVGD